MFSEKTDQFQTNYSHEHRDWIMLRENVILLTWALPVRDSRGRSHGINTVWTDLLSRPRSHCCQVSFKYIKKKIVLWLNFAQAKEVNLATTHVIKTLQPVWAQQEKGEVKRHAEPEGTEQQGIREGETLDNELSHERLTAYSPAPLSGLSDMFQWREHLFCCKFSLWYKYNII